MFRKFHVEPVELLQQLLPRGELSAYPKQQNEDKQGSEHNRKRRGNHRGDAAEPIADRCEFLQSAFVVVIHRYKIAPRF